MPQVFPLVLPIALTIHCHYWRLYQRTKKYMPREITVGNHRLLNRWQHPLGITLLHTSHLSKFLSFPFLFTSSTLIAISYFATSCANLHTSHPTVWFMRVNNFRCVYSLLYLQCTCRKNVFFIIFFLFFMYFFTIFLYLSYTGEIVVSRENLSSSPSGRCTSYDKTRRSSFWPTLMAIRLFYLHYTLIYLYICIYMYTYHVFPYFLF